MDIAGGNLFIKRAIANTKATTIDQLLCDIKIGEDYGRYLHNLDVIDAVRIAIVTTADNDNEPMTEPRALAA